MPKPKRPTLRVVLLPDVGTARCHMDQATWASMSDAEKVMEVWEKLMVRAIRGSMHQYPGAIYQYQMRELHPDASDLVNPTATPEVVCEVKVLSYAAFASGKGFSVAH